MIQMTPEASLKMAEDELHVAEQQRNFLPLLGLDISRRAILRILSVMAPEADPEMQDLNNELEGALPGVPLARTCGQAINIMIAETEEIIVAGDPSRPDIDRWIGNLLYFGYSYLQDARKMMQVEPTPPLRLVYKDATAS